MSEEVIDNDYGYKKMSLFQWVLIYLVIGGIIYGLVYYFYFSKKGGYSYNAPAMNNQQVLPSSSPANMTSGSNIITTKTDPTKGNYLADFNGMTLYTYDKDTAGTSNCYAGCATAWPPYSSGATAQSSFPTNISVVKRTDGSSQFAWKGMPLYYYANDQKAGDISGDGVGGVWHLVNP